MAFATLEPIGKPIPPDPVEVEANKRKATRAKVEGGLRALKQKQEAKQCQD